MAKEVITHERLKQRLHFNPDGAIFTWLPCEDVGDAFNDRLAGKSAGSFNKEGFFTITIDGRAYHAPELAWFYMCGQWPKVRRVSHLRRGSPHVI